MKTRIFGVFLILVLITLSIAPGVSAAPAPVTTEPKPDNPLQPGQIVTYEQRIPINIVMLGYDRNAVDQNALLSQLPASYKPVVRYPQFYGLPGRDMGLNYLFDYRVTYTNRSLTNRFFKYLKQIGAPGAPTSFQLQYNDEEKNVLDVTGDVLYIDAPSVEKWLARNVSWGKGYTLVFINWYSRPDFQFHVYTKTDEPDPDTGYNFGEIRASRKMIAWGGGSSRLWFYDLSAGPEAWTNNWNVDDPDVDGDGVGDYRMPPIWEYTEGGYRDPAALSSDLGLVTRYVGINLLFTTSPLYDPLVTAPGLGGDKVVHITMLEDDPGSSGLDWIKPDYIQDTFIDFQPYYDWQTNLVDVNPIDPGAQRAFRIFTGVLAEDDCWNAYGDPFAELFCYFDANRDTYIPAYGENDYVAGMYAFNTTDENMGSQYGLLGFADDNWVDGTQSYVFEFDTSGIRDLGYGFSSTTTHEGGHHFGMSHPHDGYDAETGLDYEPTGDLYYAWSGDESDTIMHYLALSNDFGQFDRDNLYRYEMAGYLNWSNELLDDILMHPMAAKELRNIAKAQAYALKATLYFEAWKYKEAAAYGRKTYEQVLKIANALGITPQPAAQRMLAAPSNVAPHEGDPIRFPND